jgi:hypothetical protein
MTSVDLATWLIIGCIVQVVVLLLTWYVLDVEHIQEMNKELALMEEEERHPLPDPSGGQIYLFDD